MSFEFEYRDCGLKILEEERGASEEIFVGVKIRPRANHVGISVLGRKLESLYRVSVPKFMGSAFHCRGAAVKIWGGFEFLEEERGAREECSWRNEAPESVNWEEMKAWVSEAVFADCISVAHHPDEDKATDNHVAETLHIIGRPNVGESVFLISRNLNTLQIRKVSLSKFMFFAFDYRAAALIICGGLEFRGKERRSSEELIRKRNCHFD
nr:hypothetical protein Iba_chr02aCG21120 [Ipomoea batatas]